MVEYKIVSCVATTVPSCSPVDNVEMSVEIGLYEDETLQGSAQLSLSLDTNDDPYDVIYRLCHEHSFPASLCATLVDSVSICYNEYLCKCSALTSQTSSFTSKNQDSLIYSKRITDFTPVTPEQGYLLGGKNSLWSVCYKSILTQSNTLWLLPILTEYTCKLQLQSVHAEEKKQFEALQARHAQEIDTISNPNSEESTGQSSWFGRTVASTPVEDQEVLVKRHVEESTKQQEESVARVSKVITEHQQELCRCLGVLYALYELSTEFHTSQSVQEGQPGLLEQTQQAKSAIKNYVANYNRTRAVEQEPLSVKEQWGRQCGDPSVLLYVPVSSTTSSSWFRSNKTDTPITKDASQDIPETTSGMHTGLNAPGVLASLPALVTHTNHTPGLALALDHTVSWGLRKSNIHVQLAQTDLTAMLTDDNLRQSCAFANHVDKKWLFRGSTVPAGTHPHVAVKILLAVLGISHPGDGNTTTAASRTLPSDHTISNYVHIRHAFAHWCYYIKNTFYISKHEPTTSWIATSTNLVSLTQQFLQKLISRREQLLQSVGSQLQAQLIPQRCEFLQSVQRARANTQDSISEEEILSSATASSTLLTQVVEVTQKSYDCHFPSQIAQLPTALEGKSVSNLIGTSVWTRHCNLELVQCVAHLVVSADFTLSNMEDNEKTELQLIQTILHADNMQVQKLYLPIALPTHLEALFQWLGKNTDKGNAILALFLKHVIFVLQSVKKALHILVANGCTSLNSICFLVPNSPDGTHSQNSQVLLQRCLTLVQDMLCG